MNHEDHPRTYPHPRPAPYQGQDPMLNDAQMAILFGERNDEAIALIDGFIAYATGALFEVEGWRGHALMGMERYPEALDCYNRQLGFAVLPEQVSLAEGHRAFLFCRMNRGEEAVAAVDRALSLVRRPSRKAGLLRIRTMALSAAGRHDDALANADVRVAANPFDGDCFVDRAYTLVALGRHAEAMTALETALWLNPALVNVDGVTCEMEELGEDPVFADAFKALIAAAEVAYEGAVTQLDQDEDEEARDGAS